MSRALIVALVLAAGCTSRPARPSGDGRLAGGEWVDPMTPGAAETPADRAGGLMGFPPLWFYEKGPDGYLAIPALASYHADRFHFWFFFVGNLGWTDEGPTTEGGEEAYETTDWDFNLAGVYNSNYDRVRTPSRVIDRRKFRFLWFVPIYSSEETRTATGTVRRSWLFGLIPLD